MGATISIIAAVIFVVVVCATLYLKFGNGKKIKHRQGDGFIMVLDQIGPLNSSSQPPKFAPWKKVEINEQDKKFLKSLKDGQFAEQCTLTKCAKSNQVMREPIAMKCCNGKTFCDKQVALDWFVKQKKQICPLCDKNSSVSQIIDKGQIIDMAKKQVLDFRKRLLITFQQGGLSPQFRKEIDEAFGQGYSQNHLS